jgi:NAD(P)-dependent dehydrogenase (short-subunit alcohol dehydrogenase family)
MAETGERTMDGRVALITGAGSGIGEAAAHRFGERGATVVVVDIDEENGRRVVGDLHAEGAEASFFGADVVDPDQAAAAVEHAVSEHGALNMAVNNAGIGGALASTEEYEVDEWRRVMAINVDAVFFCMRAELRHMLAHGGGAIVNTGSIFSLVARDMMPAYVTAKHAVLGMTRAAAIDCCTRGVRVNSVGPAVIQTPLLERSLDDEASQALADLNPTLRHGTPREVANVMAWLCSDEASFVNGALFPVDGAFTAR